MSKIFAAKQIGDVSYFVKDLFTFYLILDSERIKQSEHKEKNLRKGENSKYISLSRNLTAAALRNNKRWRYGVILDGNKLSNRYPIEPISYAGSQTGKFRIKELVHYDDDTCKVAFLNWPPIMINKRDFEWLENFILSQGDEFNDSHKLYTQVGGKRRVNGHMIVKKYTYKVAHGGPALPDVRDLPSSLQHLLLKSNSTNEFEERIWTNSEYVDISGCILGIVLPKNELSNFETSDVKIVTMVRNLLDEKLGEYQIIYY